MIKAVSDLQDVGHVSTLAVAPHLCPQLETPPPKMPRSPHCSAEDIF